MNQWVEWNNGYFVAHFALILRSCEVLNMRGWHCTSARLAAIRQSTSIWGSFFCWGHERWFFQGINLQSTVRVWDWLILSFFFERSGNCWTLIETNSSPLKIVSFPKRKLIFQPSIFRGEHVSFRVNFWSNHDRDPWCDAHEVTQHMNHRKNLDNFDDLRVDITDSQLGLVYLLT